MILNEKDTRNEQILCAAKQMMTAARTAPKTRGEDCLEIAIASENDIEQISKTLIEMHSENQLPFFLRDANSVLQASAIVLIGVHEKNRGLNCGYCGYPTCEKKPKEASCAFNSIDVGIAIGSACATAADLRVDTRVMYSAGAAAQQLNLLDGCNSTFAILISVSSKNPFFDRKVEVPGVSK